MNFFSKKLVFTFLAMFYSFGLTASTHPLGEEFLYQDKLVKAILHHQPELIQSYQKGKVYLYRENIVSSSGGLRLKTDGHSFALPVIFSDEGGCYLQVRDTWMWVVCGNCGYRFEITPIVTSCPNCNHGQWPKSK